MNPGNVIDASAMAGDIRQATANAHGITRVVCPPFIALDRVASVLAGSGILIGGQNMHPAAKGAFTGEIASSMLSEFCDFVILGHSERRHLLGETDSFINEKLVTALAAGLTPILCVGETLDEREAHHAMQVVRQQLTQGLKGIPAETIGMLVVAYEPVWAIGTGKAATAESAQEMVSGLRAELAEIAGAATANTIRILYGGSVNPANATDIANQMDIDGALVGGASLVAEDFAAIVHAFAGS